MQISRFVRVFAAVTQRRSQTFKSVNLKIAAVMLFRLGGTLSWQKC